MVISLIALVLHIVDPKFLSKCAHSVSANHLYLALVSKNLNLSEENDVFPPCSLMIVTAFL